MTSKVQEINKIVADGVESIRMVESSETYPKEVIYHLETAIEKFQRLGVAAREINREYGQALDELNNVLKQYKKLEHDYRILGIYAALMLSDWLQADHALNVGADDTDERLYNIVELTKSWLKGFDVSAAKAWFDANDDDPDMQYSLDSLARYRETGILVAWDDCPDRKNERLKQINAYLGVVD